MTRVKITLSFFFIFNFINSQNLNIDLPNIENDHKLNYGSTQSIYITKDGILIFEKDTIQYSELKYKLYVTPYQSAPFTDLTVYSNRFVQIFADAKTPYKIVDSVKTEIAGVEDMKHIIYRTNFDKKFNQRGLDHKLHPSFFNLKPKEKLLTRKQLIRKDSIEKIENERRVNESKMFPDVPNEWKYKKLPYLIEDVLYSIRPKVINEVLEKTTYRCITLTNKGFKLGGENVMDLNLINLKKILESNKVIICYTDDTLDYGTYLKYLSIIKEIEKNDNSFKRKYATIVEMSRQIKWLHNKLNISFCK
ncbi:MAG: hypothetical protein CMC76_01470 [Flavobacteriaceae bacterium]|uniref:hypothetical protein n=1 Tax=Winogradskyella sp. SYSU M77433 TaxID=3042722 RepID=UPI000C46F1A7|nr:hypothetical protein [Winogradskyella sp. SYSU M77433]MAX69760.1 hypothetical protein [Flavobacteriaceae bacterium]MDH7914482.1 hypothetical protein [Winogradskyella sp. SYSU M77433]|tara:strand:+ start:452 stop:1369 length:918 start_codon:yes stop_codon:yes gene_type:complete